MAVSHGVTLGLQRGDDWARYIIIHFQLSFPVALFVAFVYPQEVAWMNIDQTRSESISIKVKGNSSVFSYPCSAANEFSADSMRFAIFATINT